MVSLLLALQNAVAQDSNSAQAQSSAEVNSQQRSDQEEQNADSLANIPTRERAEQSLQRCGDIITNKGCDSGITLFSEVPHTAPSVDDQELRERRAIVDRMLILRGELRRSFGFEGDISGVESICKREPLTDCRQAAAVREKELRELALLELELSKRAEERATVTPTVATKEPATTNNATSVTIIQQEQNIRINERPRPVDQGFRPEDPNAFPSPVVIVTPSPVPTTPTRGGGGVRIQGLPRR